MLHPLEVLGVGDQALVHPVPVAGPARLDLLDVGVGLLLLGRQVVDLDLGVAHLVVQVGAARLELAISASSGRVARWWRSWSARASSSCTSSSFSWANGSAFSVVLLQQVGTVQGSVRIVLTRVSTVSPRASRTLACDHRQPGPLGRPVRDVDQRRAALLDGTRRRVVPQVAGHVDVGAAPSTRPSRKSPAPPHTATRRTGRSGSPATRTPCAVSGSASATVRAKSRQRGLGRPSPIRPVPVADGPRVGELDTRRTPAPRRDARPASPPRPDRARRRRGSTTSTRSSATVSTSPDRADRRVARRRAGGTGPRPAPRTTRGRRRRSGRRPPRPARRGRRRRASARHEDDELVDRPRRRRLERALRRSARARAPSPRRRRRPPGRRWCGRSAARSRLRRAWPGCGPSAWSPRSRAPASGTAGGARPAGRRPTRPPRGATSGAGSTANITFDTSAAGSPYTRPTASQSSAVCGRVPAVEQVDEVVEARHGATGYWRAPRRSPPRLDPCPS